MYCDDQVPVTIFHVLEADITENTGVVKKDIDATEVLDGCLNNLVAIGDAVVVGYSATAGLLDLFDYYISSLR